MSDPASTLFKQHGKTKRSGRRQLLIAAAGGVLLLVYVMHRRSSATAQAAVPAAVDPNALPAAGSSTSPSTFADNGGQAAQLGTDVTNSLSGLQTSIDSQTSAFQSLQGTLAQQQQAAAAPGPAPAPAPASAATAAALEAPPQPTYAPAPPPQPVYYAPAPPNTPAGKVGQPTSAGTHVNTQQGNPRQGLTYTTRPGNGGVWHDYPGRPSVFVKK